MADRELPPDLAWYPLDQSFKDIHCLRVGGSWGLDVARVQKLARGDDWGSTVGMHHEDWRRRRHAVARTEATALRWVTRWALANVEALRAAAVARDTYYRQQNRYGSSQATCSPACIPGETPEK